MSYSIRIEGLARVQRLLGTDFGPAMRAASQAIAEEVRDKIAPYPPKTIANSPSNPKGRWYQRDYGPRWVRKRLGGIGGRKTSQMLERSWGIKARGVIGAILGSRATYAPYVHEAGKQARIHGQRGWVTDEQAVREVITSGAVQRIVRAAVMHALGQRR